MRAMQLAQRDVLDVATLMPPPKKTRRGARRAVYQPPKF